MKPLAQNTLIQNRYLIVQLIGKGGMGEVYLAVDQRLGSAIALKRTFFAGDETLGNAFEREARVLARLRHPVLPKVSDHFGEHDEQYLVMEHISGDDLSKRIELTGKPFPLSWVMFWADQLLDALSYLHSHEPPIIHRDIKPQNLKLTDENHIVLLDFGLSKTSTGQTNLSAGSTGSTGSVVGYTPHYAPMEQIRGIGTSPKSDLYSLSATLYQLMTNTIPADALTRADSMLNGLPDPIKAPTLLNSEVPPAVSEVILRGMEVSQEKRYATAREMQKALRKAFSEMQNAMSAQTVAFNANDLQTNGGDAPATNAFEATEVMDPAAIRAISNPIGAAPGSSAFSESISQPVTNHGVDPNVGNWEGDSHSVRQADVKTEVFIAGSDAFPSIPQEPKPPAEQSYGNSGSAYQEDYSYGGTSQPEVTPAAANGESFSPDATMPYVAFEAGNADAFGSPASQPVGFETVVNQGGQDTSDQQQQQQAYVPEPEPAVAAPAAVKPAAKKKGSAGKVVALLGGLFLFFVVVLAAGGGGWYYYNNYYAGAVTDPSPTPEPTPEVTPSPEPTVDIVIPDNSNTNADNSNSTSDLSTPTPSPTPEPTERPITDGPSQNPTPGATRTPRPQTTRTPRTTPTKKPGGTGPDILQ